MNAEDLKDLRPISLLGGGLYEILNQVLVKRLKVGWRKRFLTHICFGIEKPNS